LFNYSFKQRPGTLLGGGVRKKRKNMVDEASTNISVTTEDPTRPNVDSTEGEIETGLSMAEQKRKRRQRATKGNNPFVRGATVLG